MSLSRMSSQIVSAVRILMFEQHFNFSFCLFVYLATLSAEKTFLFEGFASKDSLKSDVFGLFTEALQITFLSTVHS